MNKKTILSALAMMSFLLLMTPASYAACQEQTLFKQLDCLISDLTDDVNGAGIDATLTGNLLTPLGRAQYRNSQAEAACKEGNQDKATNNMKDSLDRIKTFQSRVANNTGPGKKIPGSIGNAFLAQATEIQNIEQELLDTNLHTTVCDGAKCLPEPPLGAINCELDQLIELVHDAGLDSTLTQTLVGKLTRAKEQKEAAEQLCTEDKDKKAASKLKAAQKQLKAFTSKVKQQTKKGVIEQSVADAFWQRVDVINGYIDDLLTNGVCS